MLRVIDGQITKLAAKVEAEERAAAASRRSAGIKQVETKLLPQLIAPFEQLERSALAVLTSIEQAQQALVKFIKDYPPELEKPFAHLVSLDQALRTINAANRVLATEWGQYVELPSKLEEAREIIIGLADDQRRRHVELVRDLEQQPATAEEAA